MRWIIFFSFIVLIITAELNIPDLLKNEKNIGSPGVKARLSLKGVKYVASFLTNALLTELVTVNINTTPQKILTPDGNLFINDMILGIHRAPDFIDIDLKSPNIIQLFIKPLNFSSKTILDGIIKDNVMINAPNVQAKLEVAVMKNFQGAPKLKIQTCKIILLTQPIFNMNNNNIKQILQKQIPELFQSLLCSRADFIIEERINARFGLLNPKVPLANVDNEIIVNDIINKMRVIRRQRDINDENLLRIPRQSLISSFNITRAETLALDYTLLKDIVVSPLGLETETSGEVSLRGRGGTPFGPQPLSLPPTANPDSMLQMLISDFVPNSLMYHGHTIGLFNTKIGPTTPHFGPLMQTTCSLSSGTFFCLGDIFPTLRKTFPNKKLSLVFNTIQAPVIRFEPQNVGGTKFALLGKLAISVINEKNNKEELIAEMSIDVDANMKLRLTSNTVRPKITLKTIQLKTLSPMVLLQKELDDSVLLAREVLQRLVNDILKEGIPIPVHPLFQLQHPKVKIMNRALLLQTNFALNEQLLRQLTAADLRKRVIRV